MRRIEPPLHGPAALAARAIALARGDAHESEKLARAALEAAEQAGDAEAASMAERALGLVLRERQNVRESARHLRRAVRIAEKAGLDACAGEARMSLVGTLVMQGNWSGALREADRAELQLDGVELARLRVQKATVLLDQGRLDEALAGYRRALPVLRRAGDALWLARVFNNRGLVHLQKGVLPAAEADFRRAEELHAGLGQERSLAHVRENLGLLASLRGDVPAALAYFDQVDAALRGQGLVDAAAVNSRCLALLTARLAAEAKAKGAEAVDMLRREERQGYLAKARLWLAEAALLDGDLAGAAREARAARQAFTRQRRPAWAALAGAVLLRARWLSGERSPALVGEARSTAQALAAAGFRIQALDADILCAQVALSCGRVDVARHALARTSQGRSKGPVQLRARAWHAEALLRLADGNRRGAEAALRAGMRVIEHYRVALGATELRAHASGHVGDLAQLGIHLAIEDGRATRVLEWAERWRAGSLRVAPARPPGDELLAADLARLRSVVSELDAAALAGRPTRALIRRQAELEESVRGRARRATASFSAAYELPPSAGTVMEGLHEHALVEMVDDRGELYAVAVAGGEARLHRLAPVADVVRELEALRFAFRRQAHARGSPASVAAARAAAEFGARRLDDLLLAPLLGLLGSRPMVIVPTSALHAVPWSALPTCRGRAVTVAPSAAVWLRARRVTIPSDGDLVFVAGPGLPHADREVRDLAGEYRGARRLTGDRARCDTVCASLDGARLAHVACHGHFRADNPLFSCLQLADGPVTVYDLERLERAPRVLVLSACDSGLSDVRPGDELMGLAASVLSMGTASLVASVFPVADEATRQLMLDFHRRLRGGASPAQALADAQSGCRDADPRLFAAAASFVCFGGGGGSLAERDLPPDPR